ncbi:hypothetical protein [Corynebacterium lubricantis]|uniref:hypothetical protein n=1 Tax=Corynebacterium lubricantis TaxID=541095 RepID=UPI0003705C41|nr:hypothetical protein [Corynebacterium lubricantis]
MSTRGDIVKVLAFTLAIMVAVLFIARFGVAGIAIAVVIGIGAIYIARRSAGSSDPEITGLRASLAITRDDINDVIDEYDTFLHGSSTEAIADRTLHYPALAEDNSEEPAIVDFKLRVSAARRFSSRIDAHLADPTLSKEALERLLAVSDERVAELALSWADARRAAKRLGPS